MAARASAQIAGVDGCKAGWIAVILQPDSPARAEAKVFENLTNLAGALNPDSIIAVDMPIGLPERASKGGRAPDWAAKEFLGPRKGSVFLVPSRPRSMRMNKATRRFAPWRARPQIRREPLRYRLIQFFLAFNNSIRCYGRTTRCAAVFSRFILRSRLPL